VNHCLRTIILIITIILVPSTALGERVIVSVHPLALAVKEVAPEGVEIETLIPAGASPHTYQMRPSQIIALSKARAVYWLHPKFETGVGKKIAQFESSKQLAEHTVVEQGDYHLWLNPAWVFATLETIVVEQEWPDTKLIALKSKLATEMKAWQARVGSIEDQPVVVAHDAFQHFRSWAPFNQLAVVQPNPERPPTANHIYKLNDLLQGINYSCLLVEPSTPKRTLTYLKAYGLPIVDVDPLGINSESYIQLIESLVSAIESCVEPVQTP